MVYQKVRNELMRRINSGQLPPGEQIASEEKLAEEFRASRTSVRTALITLEHEGYLERKHGIGTFVRRNPPRLNQSLNVLSTIPELIREQGYTPSLEGYTSTSAPGPQEAYTALGIPEGENLLCVKRVYLANAIRAIYVVDYFLTHWNGRPIVFESYHDELLKALEVLNGISVERASALISAMNANDEIAERLHIPVGTAVLVLSQTGYARDNPVFHSTSYQNPQFVRYEAMRLRQITSL